MQKFVFRRTMIAKNCSPDNTHFSGSYSCFMQKKDGA